MSPPGEEEGEAKDGENLPVTVGQSHRDGLVTDPCLPAEAPDQPPGDGLLVSLPLQAGAITGHLARRHVTLCLGRVVYGVTCCV